MDSIAEKIRDELLHGSYVEATSSWSELESVILRESSSVVIHSFIHVLNYYVFATRSFSLSLSVLIYV